MEGARWRPQGGVPEPLASPARPLLIFYRPTSGCRPYVADGTTVLGVPFACSSFIAALFGVLTAAGAADKQTLVPSITVVGEGKVTAKPDMAQVQVGVVTEAPSAAKALKDNNDAMQRLFATLEDKGIAKKDVQTANFSVTPQYKRGPHGEQLPEVVGCQVSNEVRVKVRNLESLGPVLDDVVQQEANRVQGVSFAVADPTPLLDEARRKAELYAKEAGAPHPGGAAGFAAS
jgi:uncharacterized protein YggE